MKNYIKNQQGQALITMIFIASIAITIIMAASVFILQNMKGTSLVEQGTVTYYAAESGAQEALLRMIRDSSYTGTPQGQPLVIYIDGYPVSVDIKASSQSGIITASGTFNNSVRKIQVQTVYNNNVRTITSWKEIY